MYMEKTKLMHSYGTKSRRIAANRYGRVADGYFIGLFELKTVSAECFLLQKCLQNLILWTVSVLDNELFINTQK